MLINNNLISAKSQVIENGGPTIYGVNSAFCRRDVILFRHPTRQLTSSAKAKEVIRPP